MRENCKHSSTLSVAKEPEQTNAINNAKRRWCIIVHQQVGCSPRLNMLVTSSSRSMTAWWCTFACNFQVVLFTKVKMNSCDASMFFNSPRLCSARRFLFTVFPSFRFDRENLSSLVGRAMLGSKCNSLATQPPRLMVLTAPLPHNLLLLRSAARCCCFHKLFILKLTMGIRGKQSKRNRHIKERERKRR